MFTQNELASHDARAITLLVLGAFVLGATLGGAAFGLLFQPGPAPPHEPKVIREYYQQCRTCGEWLYKQDGPPTEPIESCPLCPMTVEEFEAIQRQLRPGDGRVQLVCVERRGVGHESAG